MKRLFRFVFLHKTPSQRALSVRILLCRILLRTSMNDAGESPRHSCLSDQESPKTIFERMESESSSSLSVFEVAEGAKVVEEAFSLV